MAEGEETRGPAGRAAVWRPWNGRAASWPWLYGLGRFADRIAERLRDWARTEAAPGQLAPWLAVAFGGGIALYFAAPREPFAPAPLVLVAVLVAAAVLLRARPVAFPAALIGASLVAGFAAGTLKRFVVDHPVLQAAAWNVEVSGFVEQREERERSDRILVRVDRLTGIRRGEVPDRVRVSVRKGTAPAIGSFVGFKARLSPPLQPLRPGGYDYARDMYFHGIGASGFVLGRIRTMPPPSAAGWDIVFAAKVAGLRDAIDARIRAVLPGDKGSIASALITGKRDAISAPVNDAMYVSSLAHVLSISGYHMALVAGVVFFLFRASLALVPSVAMRRPIKKWAALAALLAATFYLVLSGAEVATRRSFVMVAIVLVGVMADRPALTLRTLTIAAFAVLVVAPEAVVHPSFQMSFAATLALVAGYRGGLAWARAGVDTPVHARVALWGVRELITLVVASLLAGLATTPYAAYHFHRLAPYGILSNLLAMPVVSAWVMPAGLLGLVAMPFGYDGLFWQAMGWGIAWMTGVAQWVAALPGAVGRVHAFGIAPLIVGTLGLVTVCLLRTPLRWVGALLVLVAVAFAARERQPDVLVAGDGTAIAVRGAQGRLSVAKIGSDVFPIRDWLAADADPRDAKDKSLGVGFVCDAVGCVARLADGRRVAFAREAEAFADDCRRAALVISPQVAPADCPATVIDRETWQRRGALALYATSAGFDRVAARPPGTDRPWARAVDPEHDPAADSPAAIRRLPDSTPRSEDLEADD